LQPAKAPEADRTPEVVPEPRPCAPWRLRSVEALPGARLKVVFADGSAGEVEMQSFLQGPKVDGSVFEALRDPAYFAKVRLVLGAVEWPNGADLAPDAMYEAIRARGAWTLE